MTTFHIAIAAAVANLLIGALAPSPINLLVAVVVGVAVWADRS